MFNWEVLHRVNSALLGVFIAAHLGVHLLAVHSPEAHALGLAWMRQYYSDWRIEAVLIASLLIQIVSGWAELRLTVKPAWRVVRNLSGLYLAAFMLTHVGSVFHARHVDQVPTDFYWVAGAFTVDILRNYAMAFYGLGVFSLFAHLIAVAALAWPGMPWRLNLALWAVSASVTAAILLAFSGTLYALAIPETVRTYYEAYWQTLMDRLSG